METITIKEEIKNYLISNEELNSYEFSCNKNLDHQKVVGELNRMNSFEIVSMTKKMKQILILTSDGQNALDYGFPENRLVEQLLTSKKIKKQELNEREFSEAIKLKLIVYNKEDNTVELKNENYDYKTDDSIKKAELLNLLHTEEIDQIDNKLLNEYEKKKKYVERKTINYFIAKKGEKFSANSEVVKDLTFEMLNNDKYLNYNFKQYNFNSQGKQISKGALHPLLIVRNAMRNLLLELGFVEMQTNCYVASSFWNFDTLFIPQQHPARDSLDTFFLENPKSSCLNSEYESYFQDIKKVHEVGGYGSLGWRYKFSDEVSMKNILRTHTTAVSTQVLFKIGQLYQTTGKFTPQKFFSIDRVFRNETIDKTHLAEFHQIEGIVADYNMGLDYLMGLIEDFFARLGLHKLRYKPAFNPYTEPSMEIYAYHEKMKKWIEIGNSGIFRPEMLLPMGLPPNVQVCGWGLSVERPAMIHYGLDNIRELFGHEVKISDTQNAKIYSV